MGVSICDSPPIFLDNKYTACYLRLVEKAQLRPFPDERIFKHHIWPIGTDGPKKTKHIVKFTNREHFIAHHLLIKMTVGLHKRNMCHALGWFHAHKDDPDRKLTARQYEIARKAQQVCHSFYMLIADEYVSHPDFYRYSTTRSWGGGSVRKGMNKGIHVITNAKHEGECYAWTDVGVEAMQIERQEAFNKAHKNRKDGVTKAWEDRPRRKPKVVTPAAFDQTTKRMCTPVKLMSPEGVVMEFKSLSEMRKTLSKAYGIIRITEAPHLFTRGEWAGWTKLV